MEHRLSGKNSIDENTVDAADEIFPIVAPGASDEAAPLEVQVCLQKSPGDPSSLTGNTPSRRTSADNRFEVRVYSERVMSVPPCLRETSRNVKILEFKHRALLRRKPVELFALSQRPRKNAGAIGGKQCVDGEISPDTQQSGLRIGQFY